MSCSHVNADEFEAQGWCPRDRRVTDCVFIICSCHGPQGYCTECEGDPTGAPEIVYRNPDDLAEFVEAHEGVLA